MGMNQELIPFSLESLRLDPEIIHFDHRGDPYIPYREALLLTSESLLKSTRPGFPLAIHMLLSESLRKDIGMTGKESLQAILDEGIIVASRHSNITNHLSWFFTLNHACVIAVSPYVFTQEGEVGSFNERDFALINDPLVGLTQSEAVELFPIGLLAHLKKWRKRGNLLVDRPGYIWRCIPKEHFVAVMDSGQDPRGSLAQQLRGIVSNYERGEITEEAVAGEFELVLKKVSIKFLEKGFNLANLSQHLAAGETETCLLYILNQLTGVLCQSEYLEYLESLRKMRPSFPFTQSLLEKARGIIFRKP